MFAESKSDMVAKLEMNCNLEKMMYQCIQRGDVLIIKPGGKGFSSIEGHGGTLKESSLIGSATSSSSLIKCLVSN